MFIDVVGTNAETETNGRGVRAPKAEVVGRAVSTKRQMESIRSSRMGFEEIRMSGPSCWGNDKRKVA